MKVIHFDHQWCRQGGMRGSSESCPNSIMARRPDQLWNEDFGLNQLKSQTARQRWLRLLLPCKTKMRYAEGANASYYYYSPPLCLAFSAWRHEIVERRIRSSSGLQHPKGFVAFWNQGLRH